MIDWRLQGPSFGNCNCDSNCPCQFELDPTHGHCRGLEIVRIERGHFGTVRLDGLPYRHVDLKKFYPYGDITFP